MMEGINEFREYIYKTTNDVSKCNDSSFNGYK